MPRTVTVSTRPRTVRKSVSDQNQAEASAEMDALRKLIIAALPRSVPVLLSDLRDPDFRLTRPLPVSLEHEEDGVIANAYDVDMHGEGEDPQAALDDLCDCLLEYYEFLEENQTALGSVPAQDWRVMSALIQRVEGSS